MKMRQWWTGFGAGAFRRCVILLARRRRAQLTFAVLVGVVLGAGLTGVSVAATGFDGFHGDDRGRTSSGHPFTEFGDNPAGDQSGRDHQ